MVLVFDLDDTLYNEASYMQSGFKEVAKFLSETLNQNVDTIYQSLLEIEVNHGRGRVFDLFLKTMNSYDKYLVYKCISTYRLHDPDISLNVDALTCLKRFSHLPLYVVTDGNKLVQQRKVRALGVDRLVKKVYVTHQYGVKYSKPSAFCFLKIAAKEKSDPKEMFYIADNPKKDFIGIKPLGFKTIRIRQGMFKNIEADESQKAHHEVESLDELDHALLNKLL
jgi:putative hydrolase of the HAD superfamily